MQQRCDLSRIIGAGYRDVFYMKLALQPAGSWREDTLPNPYYCHSEMLYVENKAMGKNFFRNYKEFGIEPDSEVLTVEEV